MPTYQQIIWSKCGFVRRLRSNMWRSLGSAVVVGLIIAAALVPFDRPLVGGDAANGQGSFIHG
jgi:hypothetical protein